MRILTYGMCGIMHDGIASFLLNMSKNMSKETVFDYVIEGSTCVHEVDILSLGGNIYFVTKRNINPIKNIVSNVQLLKQLYKSIDAVYFNVSSLSWIFPIIIARCFGYKVFIHSHMSQLVAANSSILHKSAYFINKMWLAHIHATRLTCSKPASSFMFKPWNPVEMIYNAINITQFAFDEKIREKIRSNFGFKERYVVGFVGRIGDQKNPLFLPDILNALLKRNKDILMLIVGDGSMRKQLEAKITSCSLKNQCWMLGNRTDVPELMQAMDVFVLPSEHEGLPYVLVEAQTAGLKCVVSDVVTDEVDVTGNIKFLPLNCGAEAWAEALIDCLEHPVADRKALASFMAASPFNIENEAKRLEKILSQ